MADLHITERIAYIAALSSEGLGCAEVLGSAYCEFMDGAAPVRGERMAGVIVGTAASFYGWLELAERDPAAFAAEYARSVDAGSSDEERTRRLGIFVQLLRLLRSGGAGEELSPLPELGICELEELAARELLAFPEDAAPPAGAEDRRACAVLERRSGRHARSAWEALTLYTAAVGADQGPCATLEQYTAAACGRQTAHSALCSGVLTAAQEKRRMRAAQLVTLALLAALSPSALRLLFAGSLIAAALACLRTLEETRELTAEFDREAASMLEALDARVDPLTLKSVRRSTAAVDAEREKRGADAEHGRAADAEEEKEPLRGG